MVICVQAVGKLYTNFNMMMVCDVDIKNNLSGYDCSSYCLSQATSGIALMVELFSLKVPKEIERLYDMLPKIDNLKQLCELYYTCDSQYKHEIPQAHVDDFTDVINPKKRKSSKNHITPSFN